MSNVKIFFVLALSCLVAVAGFAKEEAIVGLADHELGDQSISFNAGVFIPFAFIDFNGVSLDKNQSVGLAGAIQWNAYLNSFFRLGMEVGMGLTFGPDLTVFLMIPITVKASYLLNYDRFEFPLSLGVGANVVKYGSENLYDVAMIVKPQAAAYYRYNSNVSFGVNLVWWLSLEFPASDYGAVMGNSLEISPSLFYHF